MCGIHFFGAMGHAPVEVDAEVTFKTVVRNGLCTVRHAVHGSGVNVTVVFYQDGPPFPGPVPSIQRLDDLGIAFGKRFSIQVVGTRPSLGFECFACLAVLDSKSSSLRNLVCSAMEPVQTLCSTASGRIR